MSRKVPPPILRSLRLVTGRILLFLIGIALSCAVLEISLRLKWPFLNREIHSHFHPKVGMIRKPNIEVRWTREHSEFFTVQRVNSLGFLDREPPSPEQRGTSCHITFIGDSFVEAKEVHPAEKFHIRLEQIADKELPDLNITTSAFGRANTGQINQFPYYDEFIKPLRPCVLVLVFVINDFANNHPVLQALDTQGLDPDHNPFVTAQKSKYGAFRLRPPDRYFRKHMLPRSPMSLTSRVRIYSSKRSYLAKWLHSKLLLWKYTHPKPGQHPEVKLWVETLSRRPRYASLADEWPTTIEKGVLSHLYSTTSIYSVFEQENLPPIFKEALEFTAFALDQFKERVEEDGVSLVILSTTTMGTQGNWNFDRMHALAKARDIPVIDQTDYILRQGGQIQDARWKHDSHWTPIGHQWAAEALLEYLRENQHICCTRNATSSFYK